MFHDYIFVALHKSLTLCRRFQIVAVTIILKMRFTAGSTHNIIIRGSTLLRLLKTQHQRCFHYSCDLPLFPLMMWSTSAIILLNISQDKTILNSHPGRFTTIMFAFLSLGLFAFKSAILGVMETPRVSSLNIFETTDSKSKKVIQRNYLHYFGLLNYYCMFEMGICKSNQLHLQSSHPNSDSNSSLVQSTRWPATLWP